MLQIDFKGTLPRSGEWRSRSSAPATARPMPPDCPGTASPRECLHDSRAGSSSTLVASKRPRYLPARAALDRPEARENTASVTLTPTSGSDRPLVSCVDLARISGRAAIGQRWRQFAPHCAASAHALGRDALPRAWMRQRGATPS